jgi:hypothetical protein
MPTTKPSRSQSDPTWVTISAAAKALGVNRAIVYALVEDGLLVPIKRPSCPRRSSRYAAAGVYVRDLASLLQLVTGDHERCT